MGKLAFTDIKKKSEPELKIIFRWPVGTTCKRDQMTCMSFTHDSRCKGRTCPFRDQ